ncbi:MAG: bifunctional diguanylate cyclase/phosphodiesterase [Caulobacter sp.]|nr:bifunctional diguanylate cyclase/phosphodiesterase [Caulobacter sp.]
MSIAARRLLGLAFANADVLLEMSGDGVITLALGAAQSTLGANEAALMGQTWRALAVDTDRAMLDALLVGLEDGVRRAPVIARVAGQPGRAVSISARRLPDNEGRVSCAILAAHPPRAAGTQDGLFDREGFEAATRAYTDAARTTGQQLELAMVEVDGLTDARAALDPEAGAALQRSVAGALRAESFQGAGAARLSEDRFAILREQGETAATMIKRLTKVMSACPGGESLGAAAHTVVLDSASPARLARALRYALDDFIQEGLKDLPPASLSQAMDRSVRRTLARAGELGTAVSQRRFTLAYQPVVNMKTGQAHHHEALVRFEGGDSPFAMIRMAEEFDMIEELDQAVVEQVARQIKGDKTGKLKLAANVSGRSIGSEVFVAGLERMIKADDRLRNRLIFEVTESAAIEDLAIADRHIQTLRGLGCVVCLDDFGAGAASFAYLQRLKVDIVKIDGRYVRDLASGGRDGTLVKHLVQLCQELKVQTVAEMVETREIEEAALHAGVDFAQGWLYGRPSDRPEAPIVAKPVSGRRTGTTDDWR